MKKVWLCFCFFLLAACFQRDPVLHDTQGNAIQLSKLKNKWVIVNYWAEWCPGCVEEIPELNQFYQHNKDKNILILGVSYEQMALPDLTATIKKMGIQFPVLKENPGDAWNLGDITVLPTTFIIDPNGKVVKALYGANTEESLTTAINELKRG